ncbi:MAG TPA: hypothetical protein VN947_32175 [Polyangia bacterium]|nr:hypothetical protein [Polyangia bacterium]
MRISILCVLAALAGCAHQAPPRLPPPPVFDTPALVFNPPPRALYRFVGRVRGIARTSDFVAAARDANDDLRWKAHLLGADLVRIDYVGVPREHGRGAQVLLAGRAYKAIPHP